MSVVTPESQSSHVSFERERGVYALQVMRNVAHAKLVVDDAALRAGQILGIFQVLADAAVPVFLTKMHRRSITFALASSDQERAEQALAAAGLQAETRGGLALVVVRAASMRDLHGIMSEIADALFAAGARLYETGDSHNSVQCLIEEARVAEAEKQLCRTFQLASDVVEHVSIDAEGAS